MYNPMTEEKKVVEYRLIDDEHMPPIVITMKTIGGCSEPIYEKIDELLEAHLKEQRAYEKIDYGGE